MKLTKQDKEHIINGLINERSKNSLIIEDEQKKIENNSNSWKEAKEWEKESHIIKYYRNDDERLMNLMIEFGYKDEDSCDTDDDSYESGKLDSQRENAEIERQIESYL